MKSRRQEVILELISRHEIDTQEDMINMLRAEGFKVTQATVSRDMRDLHLTKVLTPRGTYRYGVQDRRSSSHTSNVKLNGAMVDSIVGVDFSMNNVVIKTYPGMAQAVASGVDALNIHDILGCVAGDDTIIIVTRNEQSSAEISKKIRELMKTV